MIAVGLLAARFGLPLDIARHAIARRFVKKSAAVIDANLRAFDRGVTEDEALPRDSRQALAYTSAAPKLLMSGNEASAFAAIHAGCRFFAGYPITPSSEILHFLAEWLPKLGGSSLQTEDELAALRRSVSRGAPFGDEPWQAQTALALGLESALRRQGRPRKVQEPSVENLT